MIMVIKISMILTLDYREICTCFFFILTTSLSSTHASSYSNSEILPLFFKGKDFEIVVMTKNIEPKNALPNTTN